MKAINDMCKIVQSLQVVYIPTNPTKPIPKEAAPGSLGTDRCRPWQAGRPALADRTFLAVRCSFGP